MARFVRFIVHQRIRGEPRQMGLFAAAYYLLDEGELLQHDRERLKGLLAWFRDELTVPPEGVIPSQAIFWYVDVGPFSDRMWDMVQLLKDYGFTAEQMTSGYVGRIVYQDKHQFAALPPSRRHR